MKHLLFSVICSALVGVTSFAAEAPKPEAKADAPKAAEQNPERARKMRERMRRMRDGQGMRERRGPRSRNIIKMPFGKTNSGAEASLYRVMGLGGMIIDFSDHGARAVRIYAPDKNGNLADITTGFNDVSGYEKYNGEFGATIGRFGNRIGGGKFTLDGQTYTLPLNNGPDDLRCCLHGGTNGFNSVLWKAMPIQRGKDLGIVFTYESLDGEQGFPGKLNVRVTHWLTADNVWAIEYHATVDGKATPINLTNHAYFNLKGAGNGTTLDHELTIYADKITPVDRGLIPTGKFMDVKGTAFDFTTPHLIGERINDKHEQLQIAGGYDHCWVLNSQDGKLAKCAFLSEKTTGRTVEVWTTEPGVQFYSGCSLAKEGPVPGKVGADLVKFGGMCLETQHYPDSPNKPEFPNTILKPGQVYNSRTEYRFGVAK